MGKFITTTTTPPLCVRSKLLCFSLLYLFTTLFLFLYVSLSRNQCVFRYSPFDPIQTKLFSYPSSYGEHKYALPTHRSSCSSPVYFSDRVEMEKCGLVVASAIFNDHDKIRQPVGLGVKTLETVCFYMFIDDKTLNSLFHHDVMSKSNPRDYRVGAWRIIKISKSESLYLNPAMNGVIPKYLIHILFPKSKFSKWVDAKIQLMIDPLLLIHSMLVVPEADMTISKHPFFVNTMEEAMATARWKKWGDVYGLRMQMETYCQHGLKPWSSHKLPYPTGN